MNMKTTVQLKALNVDQLEIYRNAIAKEQARLKGAFRAAGKLKAAKLAAEPAAIAKAKIAEGRAELAKLAEEGSDG